MGQIFNVREALDNELKRILSSLSFRINVHLLEAVEYSLFPGGKRIRPILCVASYKSINGSDDDKILPYACAIELIHTSSLIKDDLPAMDNHKERRGKPSVWVKFGEATALMAADILNSEAARILINQPQLLIETINTTINMTNGQDLDCRGVKSLEVNMLKTASLFEAAYVIGGIVGGGTDKQISSLRNKGYLYGIWFQHKDDLKDKGEDSIGNIGLSLASKCQNRVEVPVG